MLTLPGEWLENLVRLLASLAPEGTFLSYGFNLRALLALLLVGLACGAVGSLVVGGRMAFFSDALAHSAFAGVSIGFAVFSLLAAPGAADGFWTWVTPVMVAFGMLVGFAIAWARERTGLASDAVIGVFFASAVGLADVLRKVMQKRELFSLEDFLFGDPLSVRGPDLVALLLLVLVVALVLRFVYNPLLLGGFNPSLALSRRLPHRLASYAFVVLLAVIVNLCVRTVGILLINALMVVPAATAANLSRDLRQLFWRTLGLTLLACAGGMLAAWEIETRADVRLGYVGSVVLAAALLFALSLLSPRRRGEPAAGAAA
ncbi:MAG: metal ABC transporter permease [Gemmataceae bacterium]|nr:metal ABC transporter permease [Gemmataceae bacterium]